MSPIRSFGRADLLELRTCFRCIRFKQANCRKNRAFAAAVLILAFGQLLFGFGIGLLSPR
ncbi:hypothetical protein RLO149_c017570 [Roseobacter litoralis Och 149]|uniref:Uncharacterized protein n=1 Tax=Roseobacter litoralis (strain ATCC 49566 / DSM 6996 / JCM 21268 / NBRC 15278 / OCh 149) TaxID=391595 RepID=F7ZIN0_ROSLO|nr:hypothetical protein RLO149_c017570 [Roseobacter litoralis Och 149]